MVETEKTFRVGEGDVVELSEDLPEYGLKRGQRGTIAEVYREPGEAYDIEFEDERGTFLGLAYSVEPNQIQNISRMAFEEGICLLNEGKLSDAQRAFRKAIDLRPSYIGVLHNSIVKSFEGSDDWQRRIEAMRIVLRLDPGYGVARDNLAIAYLNYGVQKVHEGQRDDALTLFLSAIGVACSEDVADRIKQNLAAWYTSSGLEAYEACKAEKLRGNYSDAERNLMASVNNMARACAQKQSEQTRHNLGLAYGFLALFYLDIQRPNESVYWFEMTEDTGLLLQGLLNDYGVALVAVGRWADAILAFERALELDPESEVVQWNLGSLTSGLAGQALRKEEISDAFYPPPPVEPQPYLAA